jgi:hypothetical protein
MSTILRALKKLEQDKETLSAKGLSGITASAAVSLDNRRAKRSKRLQRLGYVAAVGAVFAGVAGAAVYFFVTPRSSTPPASHGERTISKIPTDAQPSRPDPLGDRTRPVAPPTHRVPAPTTSEPPIKPEPTAPESPARTPTTGAMARSNPRMPDWVQPDARTRANRSGRTPQSAEPATAPPATPPSAESVARRTTPAPPAKSPPSVSTQTRTSDDNKFSAAERLRDNRLKIQAIAWSPVADERMAVINSHIVREGSSVEGFSVIAIRQDDVIVNEQGRLYRVVFGQP